MTLSRWSETVWQFFLGHLSHHAHSDLYAFHGHAHEISKQLRYVQKPVSPGSHFIADAFPLFWADEGSENSQLTSTDGHEHMCYPIPAK